jgi:uncharacterized protein
MNKIRSETMKTQFIYTCLTRISAFVPQRILRTYRVDFVTVVVFLFSISSIAMAVPSQYCSKLSAHMQNLICDINPHDDRTLLSLDYQVSLVYEFAMFSSKSSAKLKKNQRLWLKKKELCQDQACVFESNHNRIRELEAIVDGHPNKPASPENSDLKGLWFSDGGAQTKYGNILITDNTIVWGGSESFTKNYCKTTHSIEKEPFGTSFQDQIGGTYVLNEKSQFKTYKLKLKPRSCLDGLAYLRFTLPFKILNYADIIRYVKYNGNDPVEVAGYMRFMKYNY